MSRNKFPAPARRNNLKNYSVSSCITYTAMLLSSATCSSIAFAQEASTVANNTVDANTTGSGDQLHEITVTAQRRAQSAQDVPISVAAFDGAQLQASGITSAIELGHVDPSVKTNFNQGIAFPFLRGIGNMAAGVIGNESSVAIYVDDFYYTRLYSSIVGLNDVEHVEVLKGPQGTLFGRNASGGAIQIFTKDPGKKLEVNADVGYANYDTLSAHAYLSAPLTDTLSWNVAAGWSNQRDGWGRSIVNGQKEYLGKNWTVRSKLLWEPTPTTRVKLVGFYARQQDDFGQEHDVLKGTVSGTTNIASVVPTATGYPDPVVIYPSLADSGGFYDSRNIYRTDADIETYGASLRIDQETAFADLVSISAFKNSFGFTYNQISWVSPRWLEIDVGNRDNQITQEFQIKSKASSPVNWIVGAFYMHYYAGYDPAVFKGDLTNFFVAPGAIQNQYGFQTVDSYSAFGQATVPLNDSTNVTGGLRYTYDRLKGKGYTYIDDPAVGTYLAGGVSRAHHSFQRVTWKAAIDHHFTPDLMAYASYSRGYKSGTYNTIPLSAEPAAPEIVDAYEIGFKSEFFNRRVRLNGALFLSDIKDPQVQTVVGTPPNAAAGLINAGSARSKGFELELTAIPTEGLQLRGSVTYLHARYTDFVNAPHYEGGVPGSGSPYPILTGATDINDVSIFPTTFDATGYRMPNAPTWSFSVGANYALDAQIGKFVADVSLAHTSKYNWGVTYSYNGIWQRPMALVNASLSFTPSSLDNVTISFWGKNIGNKQYYAFSEGNVYGFGASGWRGVAAAPRTYGGTITVKY
ncbi:TonB-dependent receptor [Sphingobium sp. 15-1]|uniref:TonB-dependent receptor n=1 Tax=Sphingobium sp. 15-1 TaxID=2729616 RepID=UPI00159C4DE9|nr:TonB-dependent receptor [Sphingobium sp. 15-1]